MANGPTKKGYDSIVSFVGFQQIANRTRPFMCTDPKDHALKEEELALKRQEFALKEKEYLLKLDDESAKYLESKQKLTYFLITSAVTIVGLLLDFTFKNRQSIAISMLWLILPSISGVISAGASLLSLHFLHGSYKLHLAYLHDNKAWTNLTLEQQQEWNGINDAAVNALFYAFVFLFAEVGLSALFMMGTFLS